MRGWQAKVNAVKAEPVANDFFLNGNFAELIETQANIAPLERLGQPEYTASTVAFQACEQGGWINAQVIRANGGFA
ncbi:MAG: SDR family oxidoreductase [Halomonas sp.]|uniref:SDR family oxidoreductase n=1 Tax=Halomonas sp. TaxID=1486246 RepID=UPI003F8E8FD2